jgi:4'-phosphopantetheinyl transferase
VTNAAAVHGADAPTPAVDVAVWRIELGDAATAARLARWLVPAERAHGARFALPAHRRAFETTRGALRLLLGRHLDRDPRAVPLAFSTRGKPYVTDAALAFNVSHTDGLALVATTAGTRVGIDVERVRGDVDVASIVRRFFAPSETAAFRRIPPADRRDAFFACWVRKEAYVKARGDGLARSLDDFEVAVGRPGGRGLRADARDRHAPLHWSLHDLHVRTGFAAAIAVEHPAVRVRVLPFDVEEHER